jgi:hypothetical protein
MATTFFINLTNKLDIMITLLASIVGFISSIIPELFKITSDKHDKKHELEIMDRQIAMTNKKIDTKLESISNFADIEETNAIYKTFYSNILFIDSLNASVRPVLAYAFFILYATVKYFQFQIVNTVSDLQVILNTIWTEDDQAIFAGIISFYFGQRAINKILKSRRR